MLVRNADPTSWLKDSRLAAASSLSSHADLSAVTTLNTFKSHHIIDTTVEAGARRKRAQYHGYFDHGYFDHGQFIFRPLSLELSDRWGKDLTGFFHQVCKKARELHGFNATRYGYYVSYRHSRLSVFFTCSLARQAVNTKVQMYRGTHSTAQPESLELTRTF